MINPPLPGMVEIYTMQVYVLGGLSFCQGKQFN